MTRVELVTQLAAIERRLTDRVVIRHIIYAPDRGVVGVVTRSVQRPRTNDTPHTGVKNHE